MRRRTLLIIAAVLLVGLLAAAYFGGVLFGIAGPSGSVKAWSYEAGSSTLTPVYFTAAGLTQAFVPTTTVTSVTSVYIQVEVSASIGAAQYNFVWALSCNGGFDNGGTGGAVWDTTQVISEWLPMPTNNAGNVSAGDDCSLFVHEVPLTSGHTASEVGWIAGGTVNGVRTKNTIVWGTPVAPPPAGAALAIDSMTAKTNGLTVQWSANVSGGMTPYTYNWSFGDGFHSASATPTHTYATGGTYTTTLTVTDPNGAAATQSKSVTVSSSLPPQQSTTNYAPNYTLLIVLVIGLVVAGAVIALYGRRRGWF